MRKMLLFVISVVLVSCIETDTVEDEIVVLTILPIEASLNGEAVSGLIGSEIALMSKAQNDRGITFSPDVNWNSSNTLVATISEDGLITLSSPGSSIITASGFGLQSNAITVFSVASEADIAAIEIIASDNMLSVGESVSLQAEAKNIKGEVIENVSFNWLSSNVAVAEVTQQGEVTALSDGMTSITATADGITGSITIMVGDLESRSGSFAGLNGYSVSGEVTLVDVGSGLNLELGSNFSASNGPGLYLYLSNGSNSINGGFEIGALRKNSGSDVYEIPETISLDQFSHVIVYCKPFGVGFGSATLN